MRPEPKAITSKPMPAGQWHRITMIADLDSKRYDLLVNGKVEAEHIAFADTRWFLGANQLFLYATGILLDNMTIRHLPNASSVNTKRPAQQRPVPTLTAEPLTSAPVLDGRMDEKAWRTAFHTDEFYRINGGRSTEPRMETWIGYWKNDLYMGVRLWPRDMEQVRKRSRVRHPRGAANWDRIELFINPSGGQRRAKYVHLGFDEAGNQVSELGQGGAWDGQWEVKTHIGEDYWSAEVRIPFVGLTSVSPPASSWGVNVCRGGAYGGDGAACLSPTYGGFHTPSRFARLDGLPKAVTTPTRCELAFKLPVVTGKVPVEVRLTRGPLKPGTPVQIKLFSKRIRQANDETLALLRTDLADEEQSLKVKLPVSEPGDYFWRVEVRGTNSDRPVAVSRQMFVHVERAGALHARTDLNYYTSQRTARVRISRVGDSWPDDAIIQAQVHAASEGDDSASDEPALLLDTKHRVSGSPTIIELPLTDLPMGEHALTLKLLDNQSRDLAHTNIALIRRPARHNEVKIRWDNVLIVKGEPFFPIFLFATDPIYAHELGANTILSTAAYLAKQGLWKQCRNLGIYLIAQDYEWPFLHWPINEFAKDPKRYRMQWVVEEPMFLGHYIEDEPTAGPGATPLPHLAKLSAAVREMDPYHPRFISEQTGWDRIYAYTPIVDVIGYHLYASSQGYSEHHVEANTHGMAQIVRDTKPMWVTLQAFHNKQGRVHPTPTEFRHSVYAALLSGAKGLGLFGVELRGGFPSEQIRGLQSDKALWLQARTTLNAVARLSPVLMSEQPVTVRVSCDNPDVALMAKQWQNRLYVWALNRTKRPQSAVIHIDAPNGALVDEIHLGGKYELKDATTTISLEALQPVVLRLDPD